jgi:microsomal dipeptidase-like Zn-dependent dipeptidase
VIPLPVVDLHADLPYYLTHRAGRTARDATSRCSIDQLRSGGVAVQVLTIFVTDAVVDSLTRRTDGPERAMAQARAVASLPERCPSEFERLSVSGARGLAFDGELDDGPDDPRAGASGPASPIAVLAAVENAAGLASACAPLEDAFRQLDALQREAGPLLYVGLTWRGENRFGGGDGTRLGLTDDGRRLLERLASAQSPPAVDLSHANDALAEDVLAFVDSEELPLVVIASHSNFRAVRDHRRNLPDWLAQEIAARGGIIGLNLCRSFVGDDVSALADHVAHGIALGLGGHLGLGTDFFWEGDLPSAQRAKTPQDPYRFYFPDFADAACHRPLQRLLRERGALTAAQLAGLAHGNATAFLKRLWSPNA